MFMVLVGGTVAGCLLWVCELLVAVYLLVWRVQEETS
jgi:hypothetical protein